MNSFEKQNQFTRDGKALVTSRSVPHNLVNGLSKANSHSVNLEEAYIQKVAVDGMKRTGENGATPTKPLIGSNITPRSGSRKARAESTSPTAGFIVNGSSPSPKPFAKTSLNGYSVGQKDEDLSRHTATWSSQMTRGGSSNGSNSPVGTKSPPERSATSMSAPFLNQSSPFFHANDLVIKKPLRQATSPTPGYTKEPITPARIDGVLNAQASATGEEASSDNQRSKFFYANDLPNARSPPNRITTNATPNRPMLPTIHSGIGSPTPNSVRPSSPLKDEIILDDNESDVSSSRASMEASPRSDLGPRSPSATKRRSSLSHVSAQTPSRNVDAGRPRRSSLKSNQAARPRKSSIPTPIGQQKERNPEEASSRRTSVPPSAREPSTPTEIPRSYSVFSPPQSPTKQSPNKPQSHLDHMNELAAEARRDRKVLDLEISNSSLLAINHTLEREMRKMKSELRQYRRLSRSGKTFNLNARRSASGRLQSTDTAEDELSDFELSEDEDDNDSLSQVSSSQRSSLANRAALARLNDPQIEPLDMTAYQGMLLEGQKLNQTIKRCLGRSENLLVAGKQALESSSQPLEVGGLGPRVLSPEEVEDEVIDRRQALLSPIVVDDSLKNNPWESSLAHLSGFQNHVDEQEEIQESPTTDCSPPSAVKDPATPYNRGPGTNDESCSLSLQDAALPDEFTQISPEATSTDIPFDPSIASQPSPTTTYSPDSSIAEAPDSPSPTPQLLAVDTDITDPQSLADLDETVQSTLAQLTGGAKTDTEATEDASNMSAMPPPQKAEPEKEKESSIENANTPGNRSSIQKIFSTIWSGATSLRPP